jgi:CO/xanthine dehydrogenase Mo-binding subunit
VSLSRRAFLVATGWTAGGVTVLGGCSLLPVLPTFVDVEEGDAFAWVQMRADGRILFRCPRAEMGQGIATGLSRVVADELGVTLADVECVYPRTDEIAPTPMTVGSQSIEQFYEPTARAAAGLRELLRSRAAERAGVAASELELVEGGFAVRGGTRVAYADLVSATESTVAPPGPRPGLVLHSRRSIAEREAGGPRREALHIDRLVTGTEVYSRDVQLPGMVFGAVARPRQIGARLLGWDEAAARAVPGVVAVVEGPQQQVGVVAETPMALEGGVSALGCRWSELDAEAVAEVQARLDVDASTREGALDHTPVSEGDLDDGRARAVVHLDVRYDTPMAAHAAMEPRAGVARMVDGRCEVHTASQDPWFVQGHVARALGTSRDDVLVQNHRIGGAFGGRSLCQASVEAAWLAAGSGRTVKVQWTREEEFAHNYVGPQFSHRIQAGTDAEGRIAYWHHRMVGGPIMTSSAMIPEHLHWAADLPADPGTWRGADLPYRVEHRQVDFADVRQPMPTGAWRGLGAAPNTFAVESAMGELAEAAGADPFAFRQAQALDPRLAHVLERARVVSDWDAQVEAGAQLGVAATAYKHVTFAAVVARVRPAASPGEEPRVDGLWCVQDCGYVACPDQVRAQIEGNLVWGITMALYEEFRLEEGRAATTNFDAYRIARNSEVPDIAIELVDSDAPPSGAGEAAFAPAAAAIANALLRATGTPVRRLPLIRPA